MRTGFARGPARPRPPGTRRAAFALALIAPVSVVALRILPRCPARVRSAIAPPRPGAAGVTSAVAAFGFLGLLYPFAGARRPAFTHGYWVLVPMLAAAVLAVGVGIAVGRWTWTNTHRLAAVSGALIAHTAFGVVANTHTAPDTLGLTAIGVAMTMLLGLLARRRADRTVNRSISPAGERSARERSGFDRLQLEGVSRHGAAARQQGTWK